MADAPLQELAYAVHTATCTYLLDEDGVCQWIVSPQGAVPSHVQQAVGAQFVACLDMTAEGGLLGELKAGAMALLVRRHEDRMVLLRTAPIQHVDDRRNTGRARASRAGGGATDAATQRRPRAAPPLPSAVAPQMRQYGKAGGLPYMAQPPPLLGKVKRVGGEQTITVTFSARTPTGDTHPRSGSRSPKSR
jgi:hypothetical protein